MLENTSPFRVLFVCLGNICRSPSAENVMNQLIQKRGLEHLISCDSAGTISQHRGESPDTRMTQAGKKRGLPMTGKSRQIEKSDFETFDLILAMDKANYQDILSLTQIKVERDKVAMFTDHCKENTEADVPDPYWGGSSGFELVLDMLYDGCAGLLEKLNLQKS